MSLVLAASFALCLTSAVADGPLTTITTTLGACGCSASSFIILRSAASGASVVNANNTIFGSASMIESETSGVSQEACELLLLNSTAVAYSYQVLSQSCSLHSGMTDVAAAPGTNAGAKIQEFPWLCNLYCILAGDSRWTGVVNVWKKYEHTCQCCYNAVAAPSKWLDEYYSCSASGCQLCAGDMTQPSLTPAPSPSSSISKAWSPLGLYFLLASG